MRVEANSKGDAVVPMFSQSIGSWQFSIGRRAFTLGELKGHYERSSTTWQAKIDRMGFEEVYARLLAKILRQRRYAQDTPDLHVLDAGIGTGAMTSAFSKLREARFRVDGIDISDAMLREAAGRLGRLDIDLNLFRADLGALPHADNTFDVVLVAHVLEHLPEPDRAISELYRVLKPGGLIVACITRRSAFGAYIQFLWRTHQVEMGEAFGWLRHAGFQSVRAVPLEKRSVSRRLSIGYVGRKPKD